MAAIFYLYQIIEVRAQMQKHSRTCSLNLRCSDPEDTTGLLTAPGTKNS